MNMIANEEAWEARLRAGLGEAPAPDFQAWRSRHADAFDALATANPPAMRRRRWISAPGLKWAAAAAVVLAAGLFVLRPSNSIGRAAFAATIPGVDDPLTMTWTTTFYVRVTSADGKRAWLEEERRLHAYRHPGRYRETLLDKAGKPARVEITDARAGRTLALDLKEKKAVLKTAQGRPDVRGPFAWVGEALRERMVAKALPVKSISIQGTREVDGLQANVVRAMILESDDRGPSRRDFLFDRASKRLAAIYVTNENDFDPETAPERKQAAGADPWQWMPVASLEHEIVVDPKLDAADFRLDPPAGFAYEAQARPTITEDEMIGFLGAAARFNGDAFPDSPFAAFNQTKFNDASRKDAGLQTPAEKELIALHDRYLMREVYEPPVRRFVADQTEPDTFQYVGAGAKIGQADRIVAWYTLKAGSKLRALYADLTVKDATQADLPLSLPE